MQWKEKGTRDLKYLQEVMDIGICSEQNNDRRRLSENRGLKEAELWMLPQVVSGRALGQLWSKGSVLKLMILKAVPCRGPEYQLGLPTPQQLSTTVSNPHHLHCLWMFKALP